MIIFLHLLLLTFEGLWVQTYSQAGLSSITADPQ